MTRELGNVANFTGAPATVHQTVLPFNPELMRGSYFKFKRWGRGLFQGEAHILSFVRKEGPDAFSKGTLILGEALIRVYTFFFNFNGRLKTCPTT